MTAATQESRNMYEVAVPSPHIDYGLKRQIEGNGKESLMKYLTWWTDDVLSEDESSFERFPNLKEQLLKVRGVVARRQILDRWELFYGEWGWLYILHEQDRITTIRIFPENNIPFQSGADV